MKALLCKACRGLVALLAVCAVSSTVAPGSEISFKIIDGSGVALKDILVIVQDVRTRDSIEVFRTLSDPDGRIPAHTLDLGLYRVIAITPYGLWRSEIREFLVGAVDTEIPVKLDALPSHGYGDRAILPGTKLIVEVKHHDGSPAKGIDVHARDAEASLETLQWYKTDQTGRAQALTAGETTVVFVVANDSLITKTIPAHTKNITFEIP